MNLLFMTLGNIKDIMEAGIYTDLLREFIRNGHEVVILSPTEKKYGEKTHVIDYPNCRIIKVQTGNIQKTKFIEKGISTVLIEGQFKAAIKKYLNDAHFDLILYTTPPITFAGAIEYAKKKFAAKTYLLLKDIWPQSSVDLGLLSTTGLKGLVYHYFRHKEHQLYAVSDFIGCMSEANVSYILKHNTWIDKKTVEICPNSVEPIDMSATLEERISLREKYGLPKDRIIFIYGGNLGRSQGISHVIECLKKTSENRSVFFLIVGDGTEYKTLENYLDTDYTENVKLMSRLPKEDYDKMVGSCDVGMIFLDERSTVPKFPSRILSYMQAKVPTLAITDPNTDIGQVIVDGGFGWWCEARSTEDFKKTIERVYAQRDELKSIGIKGWEYLMKNYTVADSYKIIMSHFSK